MKDNHTWITLSYLLCLQLLLDHDELDDGLNGILGLTLLALLGLLTTTGLYALLGSKLTTWLSTEMSTTLALPISAIVVESALVDVARAFLPLVSLCGSQAQRHRCQNYLECL